MTRAIVSLGSNLEPRTVYLARARAALAALPETRVVAASSVLETEPVDVPDAYADLTFLNQVVVCETDLGAQDFARRMHAIEDALGRVRTVRNGPRTIDLDLVDFGGLVLETPELTLPHPRAHERDFVMRPLAELGLALNREVGPGFVRDQLARGNRVLLVVRHSERPKIDGEDKTFGAALPLTPEGERLCLAYGRLLKGAADDVQFRASPLRRTVLTAQFIAEGLGIKVSEIPTDAAIGNGSAFIADELQVWELFRDGRFFEKMVDYLERGTQDGFNALGPSTKAFEDYCVSQFTGRLGVFTSHDVYLAAYAKGSGILASVTKDNWPRFLDAIAIVIRPDGSRDRAFVRAGLTDGICGVGAKA